MAPLQTDFERREKKGRWRFTPRQSGILRRRRSSIPVAAAEGNHLGHRPDPIEQLAGKLRSDAMVKSSFQHLMDCELSPVLRDRGNFPFPDQEALYATLHEGNPDSPIRIVAVEGTFEPVPGKSGGVMIRQFKRHLNVSKALLCRPGRLGELPDTVNVLMFTDDLVGTGKQFKSFANGNNIPPHTRHCLDLVMAFEHAVPNNSMPMLSIKSAQWQPLFDR